MSEILLFHHALGLTPGVHGFADTLRGAGHTVRTPDLYDGRVFDDLEAGVAHAQELGEEVDRRADAAVAALPAELVYAGFSLGGMPAERLALSRPGARGCLLYHTGIPPQMLVDGVTTWPERVPLQMHITEDDVWEDTPFCRQIAEGSAAAELFLYPGSAHLFADPGSADYDATLAGSLVERTLAFLDGLDAAASPG